MRASEAGQVECVKVLLDKDEHVNMQDKVSGVIIHCVYAMQHVSDDVCKGTLFSECMKCYSISATRKVYLG